jgi:Flp pilus assembly protein TadB
MEKTKSSELDDKKKEGDIEDLTKLQIIFYSIVVILTIFFLVWTIVRINIYVLIIVIILTVVYIYFDDDLTNDLSEEGSIVEQKTNEE